MRDSKLLAATFTILAAFAGLWKLSWGKNLDNFFVSDDLLPLFYVPFWSALFIVKKVTVLIWLLHGIQIYRNSFLELWKIWAKYIYFRNIFKMHFKLIIAVWAKLLWVVLIGVIHKLRFHISIGDGRVHGMSTLLKKFGKFYEIMLSTREGGGVKKVQKSVNVVCEGPYRVCVSNACFLYWF